MLLELTLDDADYRNNCAPGLWLEVVRVASVEAPGSDRPAPSASRWPLAAPWLKPQLESLPPRVFGDVNILQTSGPEARLSLVVKNVGRTAAYPVRVALLPRSIPSIWTDNDFWLAPSESVTWRASCGWT